MTESAAKKSSDLPDDIKNILDKVETHTGEVIEPELEPKKANPQVISISSSDLDDDGDDGEDSGDAQHREIVQETLKKLVSNFEQNTDNVWKLIEDDRTKIDEFLTLFSARIADVKETKICYVEAITSLLSTKANIGVNASRVLDSCARLITAAKNLGHQNDETPDMIGILTNAKSNGKPDPDKP